MPSLSYTHLLATLRRLGMLKVGGILLGGVLVGGVIIRFVLGGPLAAELGTSIPSVHVASVAELSSAESELSIVGTVSSKSEAVVRAESSGAVTSVSRTLGDSVGAGVVVAQLENSSERATVMQAQGSVAAAEANLSRTKSTYGISKDSAVNGLFSAFNTLEDVITGTADTFFDTADPNNPRFDVLSSNASLVGKINNTRIGLPALIAREKARANTLSASSNLTAELDTAEAEVRLVWEFFNDIVNVLGSGIPTDSVPQSTIDGYVVSASAARAKVAALLTTITTTRQALATAENTGTSPEVAAAEAALTQAQGTLALARASLEKTIIRAPISGTINSFSLKVGDFVTQSMPVLTVANNGALEIVAYVTAQDAPALVAGSAVDIEGGNKGVITHVAPAIDPVTKKIEVRIGVATNSTLVNGQSVIINFKRTGKPVTNGTKEITVPITAIKIGATDTVVFTVSASSTLESHTVVLGELLGERVAVAEGLTPEMEIVIDARGLRAGEEVQIAQ